MRIVLLEFIDETKVLLRKYGKDLFLAKDVITICLHPSVRVFLKEKMINSVDTLDYFNNDAQHRIILKTEDITAQITRKIHLVDSFGIKKGYEETCIHHIRLYINHFLWIIEVLKGIMEKHSVSGIYCCLSKNRNHMYTKKAYIQTEERFLGFLTQDFCKINRITFYGVPLKTKKPGLFIFLVTIVIHKIAELISIINYMFLIVKKPCSQKTIIIPAFSYNMDKLLKEMKEQHYDSKCFMIWEGGSTLKQELFKVYLTLSNFLKKLMRKHLIDAIIHLDLIRIFFKKDAHQQSKIKEEFDKLNSLIHSELSESLVYNGISIGSYLEEKVDRGLKYEILSLQHTTMMLHNILKHFKPKLLMSMYSLGIYYTMGELSYTLGFCSLSISHGTHIPPNNEFERIENYRLATNVIINTYKYVAVQTPWTDKFLDYYNDRRPRVYSGPLIYSKKDEVYGNKIKSKIFGIPEYHKVIIHASTQKLRLGMRFHIEETLDEYISTLSDLVEIIDSIERAFLIIRPHPVCNISEKEFLTLLPKSSKFKIINKGPFKDILSVADLLVSYSSTCIEEALQSKIPVILFDKWKRYNHFNIKETKSSNDIDKEPVYYVTEPAILKECIPILLNIMANSPLSDADLKEYKYPQDFRLNFDNFVDKVLIQETIF